MNSATTRSRSLFPKVTIAVMLVAVFGTSFTPICRAQSGEDLAKGLLRALIESQLEKSRRRSTGASTRLNPQPNSITQQIQQLRPITATYAQETATLGALIQTESRRNFELRPRVPEVIRFQAQASALKQRTASQRHHDLLIDDFRRINSDWGVLAHQLEQCRNLSPHVSACVNRLTALDTQFCAILGLQPQYDNVELTRVAYTLTTYVRDLVDDVQYSANRRGASRSLLRELGRFSQQTQNFAGLVSSGTSFEAIVADYQTLFASWTSLETTLSSYSDHGTARTVRRIRDTHQTLHDLLHLQTQVDKSHILNLIHDADHQLNQLFKSISLEQLMALPDGSAVPDAADALSGTIQNIDDLVHRDQSQQVIGEAWVYVDDAWNRFSYFMNPTRTHHTVAALSNLDATLGLLQQALAVVIQYDQRALVKSASTLEQLSEQLNQGLRRWQSRPGQHDRSLANKAAALTDRFHHIEQSIGAGQGGPHNLQECDEAIVVWQQIRPALETCNTPERAQFDRTNVAMTEELIRLRTMLDN